MDRRHLASRVLRAACATWLVVVFLGLILGVPYLIGRPVLTSPLDDPVVQILFLLAATAVPAAFGLAYAAHRQRSEETEAWLEGLR